MIGQGLPAPLADRLAAGDWLRTAHRGAPLIAPGNSARALRAAADLGVDLVEIDVHAARDGRIVLWHDPEIAGPDGIERRIAESSYEELGAIDLGDGQRLIDLSEAIEIVRGRAGLMVDLKADDLGKGIVEVVRAQSFDPVVVCGGYWRTLQDIKRREPRIGTSLTLSGHWRAAYGLAEESEIDTDAVTLDARLIEPGFIERLHARGLAVLVWTIDDPDDMRACLGAGADGLTSNRPDLFSTIDATRPVQRALEVKP